MAAVGRILKRPVITVVTDMEQPLGMAVGHTTEVIEAIETLKGRGPDDLRELCMELGSLALVEAGKAKNQEEGMRKLGDLIASGEALKSFGKLIEAQGGDSRVLEDYSLMPQAKMKREFLVPGQGNKWIKHLDGRKVAEACKVMGAGRTKKGDPINLAVGVVLKAKVGDTVSGGAPLATIYCDSEEHFNHASAKLTEAFEFSDTEVKKQKLIKASIT
jgi:pyrimidine-nucleoside phosphorylase